MAYVFVYGTLRQGERNAHLLKEARYLDEHCWIYGELYDTGNGYPAVTLAQDDKVYGELYEVTEEELAQLDDLEGYKEGREDNLYDRVICEVVTKEGPVSAYVYVAAKKSLLQERIWDGDWIKHQR